MLIILNVILAAMFGYLAAKASKAGAVETIFGNFRKDQQPGKFNAYVASLIVFSVLNIILLFLKLA